MLHTPTIVRSWTSLGLLAFGLLAHPAFAAGGSSDFAKVRAVLSDKCFACHGPDEHSRKAKFRMDLKAEAFRDLGGYSAIVPGKPQDSEIYKLITSADPEARMPPAKHHKQLTKDEIEVIRLWIERGAEWQEHWSFSPLLRPAVPQAQDPAWTGPVDAFVLAKLRESGLTPNEEAPRRSLIRRVTLDLTGLPPTEREVADFLADSKPGAYERVVDRLLASPRYGEHMARYWLDAARYGDTHGLHLDNYREMWPYRDWVVKAYNDNKPYDVFLTEQLAGDLLPQATIEQRVASGFNRAHVTTAEGGSISEEVYVRNVIDRVNTTGTVFMGLTLGCAVCHDHKYDPVSMKDYYALFAFFNSLDDNPLDGNRKDHAPVIRVPTPEQTARMEAIQKELAAVEARLKAPWPEVDALQAKWEQSLAAQSDDLAASPWSVLTPHAFKARGGSKLRLADDAALHAEGPNPATEVYEVVARTPAGRFQVVRLEGLLPTGGVGVGRSSNGNIVLTEFTLEAAPVDAKPGDEAAWKPVPIASAVADYEQEGFPVAGAIDGKAETGWAVHGNNMKDNRYAAFVAGQAFGDDRGALLRVRLKHESQYANHQFGRFRLSVAKGPTVPPISDAITLGGWVSAGPFTAKDGDAAYAKDFGPEKKAFNAKESFKNGKTTVAWVARPHWVDGAVHSDLPGEYAATYLHRTVDTSAAREAVMYFGSDDAIKVWVNGKEALASKAQRAAEPDQEKLVVRLNRGRNSLLVKIVNYGAQAGFFFRMEGAMDAVSQEAISIASTEPSKRTEAQTQKLRSYYRRSISDFPALLEARKSIDTLGKERAAIEAAVPTTLVSQEIAKPRDAYLLKRGQYDQRGDKVGRATPAALPPMPKDAPMDRLGLARWLLAQEHPLTARVIVNRYWQQFFGVGLVKTSEDFGSQGEPPVNAGLLDWLASEYRSTGWDTKRMVRTLVTSAAYRQASRATPLKLERDAENRLLARGPRHRLDAEAIRDQALFVSGLLVERMGGPGVRPPQPEGLWEAVGYVGSNTANFVADRGAERVHRRSIYTFWKRTSPPPQMGGIDAPSREACSVRRERTNTPLQALLLLNDPQYVEAARALAQAALRAPGVDGDAARIGWLFERCLQRGPESSESQVLAASLQRHRARFRADTAAASGLLAVGEAPRDAAMDAAELASWTLLCNTLMNTDEFLNKP